ncbi:MAG: NHLP bacteriocin system secretion protein [Xenococcaceae cyanobacterium]
MSDQEKKLFRQEALERLSSPERLDQLLKVVNPRAWLPLSAIGSLAVIAGLWSVFGRLPLTVTGKGVLIQPRQVVAFQAPDSGQVLTLNVQPGDRIKKGDVLGRISQPGLEQQLRQEQERLDELLGLTEETTRLERQRIAQERESLAKRRANLKESLERAKSIPSLRDENIRLLEQNRANLETRLVRFQEMVPRLRERNTTSLAKNRESLNQRLVQIRTLLPSLEKRLEDRRRLVKDQLVTGDVLLAAEREYFNSLAQLSELETQLKQLDVEATNSEAQYLQNLSRISELQTAIQEINVQLANVHQQYLESLNQLDELRAQLQEIVSEEARLKEQEKKLTSGKRERIAQLEDKIERLKQQLADKSRIISKNDGKVLEVSVVPGRIVGAGTRLGSIEAGDPNIILMSFAYFADKDGKKIKPGMEVQVTPSFVKRERYGGIVGEVTEVSSYPVTIQNMSTNIGSENLARSLAEEIASSGGSAPIQVKAILQKDDNTSGYQWSSSDGPPTIISSGTTTQVRVKIGEVAPISYVIPLLRSLTGVY